jgi:predicted MFS family arabinose efflux permease
VLAVLRQRNFALLWVAGLISMTGDWALVVGLPVEIYRRTGSTLATAGMVLASLVPAILLGSIAGIFVDRWDRRRLMVAVNLALAATVLPLMLVDATGIWIAYAVLVVASCLEQLFLPAEVALLPNLLEGGEAQLVTANALSSLNRQIARIIGPAIGGVAVTAGGLTGVTIVDAVSFVAAAGLILAIRTRSAALGEAVAGASAAATAAVDAAGSAWGRLVHEWRAGLAIVRRDPVLRALLVFMVITQFGEGLLGTLFVPWATDALHADAAGYGSLLSAQAIGGVVGALAIGRLGTRVDPLRLLILGSVVFGLIDLALFTYPVIWPFIGPALVGMVIVGFPAAAVGTGYTTLQQTSAPDSHRGRVVGALMAVGAFGSLLGAVLAGVLGEVVPVIPLLIVQGSGYIVAGFLVARMIGGRRRREAPVPAPR